MTTLYRCPACEHTKVWDGPIRVDDEHPCPQCGKAMQPGIGTQLSDVVVETSTKRELDEFGYPIGLKHGYWPDVEAKVEDIDTDKQEMVVAISTDTLDRDMEVLLPAGMDNTNFRKNPVVPFGHDYRNLPIGKSLWEKKRQHDVIAKVKFKMGNDFAEQVWEYYRDGYLKAWSVGFDPRRSVGRAMTEEDVTGRPDWAGGRWIWEKWPLWEFSAAPIPSNPDALALAIAKGVLSPHPMLLSQLELPEVGEVFPWQKPYPNEHACRKRNPGDFQEGSFRRMSREHDGKKYGVIMGRLKGETTLTEQSYRYPKDVWTVASAKAHCKSHQGILFEPAKDVRDAELLARPVKRLAIARKPFGVVRAIEVRKLTAAALKGRVVVEED